MDFTAAASAISILPIDIGQLALLAYWQLLDLSSDISRDKPQANSGFGGHIISFV